MSIEKLRQAAKLIQECIDEYGGEESEEGAEPSGEYEGDSEPMPAMGGGGAGDKIKMAAALMRRGK